MSTQQDHMPDHHKARRFWRKEEIVLGTLAALLAFTVIYAYTGDADLYYPLVGALGMGSVIYSAVWMAVRRKFR